MTNFLLLLLLNSIACEQPLRPPRISLSSLEASVNGQVMICAPVVVSGGIHYFLYTKASLNGARE
jgi:hypothetical protein